MSYGGETGQMDTRATPRVAATRDIARETTNVGDDDGGE
jgi:hypothetical protein